MKLSDIEKRAEVGEQKKTNSQWVGIPETLNDCDNSHTLLRPMKDISRSPLRPPRSLRA